MNNDSCLSEQCLNMYDANVLKSLFTNQAFKSRNWKKLFTGLTLKAKYIWNARLIRVEKIFNLSIK
jgi:hypothetical protein